MKDPLPTNYLFIRKRRHPSGRLLAVAILAAVAGAAAAVWLLST